MGAGETNLSNARAFLVNHTRQQMDVRLFTDDQAKLIRQLESNRGDKTSALEAIGELRSEEHTSELQSLMRISYAVFCLKKNNNKRKRLKLTTDTKKYADTTKT